VTVLEEITRLVDKVVESGMEIPDFILMHYDKFNRLNKEGMCNSRYMGSNSYSIRGQTAYQVTTRVGSLAIHIDPNSSSDHLSIGRMTLDDFIIEEILFDKETINDSNNY
jgi:hypothetical protein